MTAIIIYLIIGLIVALANNHIYSKLQPIENNNEDNPAMIVALIAWIVIWPLGIVTLFRMIYQLYKTTN